MSQCLPKSGFYTFFACITITGRTYQTTLLGPILKFLLQEEWNEA